jgi:hypothetical protein
MATSGMAGILPAGKVRGGACVRKDMKNYSPFLGGGSMAGYHQHDPPPRRTRDRTRRARLGGAALVLGSAAGVALMSGLIA